MQTFQLLNESNQIIFSKIFRKKEGFTKEKLYILLEGEEYGISGGFYAKIA